MESTLKRTWAEISLDNLTHNFETIRRQVGPKAKLLGVVKADAYGHGAVRVAKHLERLGAGYLAVSNLDECEELRVNGITLPILMLGFTPADQAERILKNDMTQAVPNLAIAEAYSSAAVHAGGTMKVHIKLDTGMGRLGFQCDDAHFDASLRDILKILTLPGLDVEGVFTHFCVSDEAADECVEFTKIQHDRFLRMIDAVETQGNFRFRLHHCCNAGGIASYPEWAWDMVRCGIILYGTGRTPPCSLPTTGERSATRSRCSASISSSRPPPSSAAPSATSCFAPSASACRAIITSAANALTAISSSSDKHRPRAPRIG